VDALEILRGLLSETRREPTTEPDPEPEIWDPYSVESMLDWAESEVISQQGDRLRIRGVPRIEEIVRWFLGELQARRQIRLAILGPRGGGKTFLVAAMQLLAARWYGGSTTNLGGSKEQAARCYAHILRTIQTVPDTPAYPDFRADVATRVRSSILSKTVFLSHAEIEVLAASPRSVRGAHPKGPSGLGVIVIDEAALVDDHIVDAAKKQVVVAKPSAIVQTSTMGTDQRGAWWRLTQQPKQQGYQLFAYDVFDVASRCPYDCATTCPVPEHFARDYSLDVGGGRSQHVHKAYCAGKAHEVNGHVEIDEIAQQFRESDRLSFERELMGWGSANVGKVYDAQLIERAISQDVWLDRARDPDQHWRRFLLCEKAAGLDWGYSAPSQTAVAWGLRWRDKIVVYRWQFWSGERFSVIRGIVAEACFRERVGTVRPDGANPSDNDELQELLGGGGGKHLAELARASADDLTRARGANGTVTRTFLGQVVAEEDTEWDAMVEPVNFSREKDYGIGEIRRRLEHGTIIFAARFGGQEVQNHDRAMDYLRGYHYDDNGKPAKVDDHGPDALLCLVGTWAPRRMGSQ